MKGETMFIDARRIEEGATIQATVCIIGGGVAGITLAREMDRYGIDTCLLESGGFDPDDDTRDLYRGEDVGLPYIFADGCRGRFLGGRSNCWPRTRRKPVAWAMAMIWSGVSSWITRGSNPALCASPGTGRATSCMTSSTTT